jgi:hypothetical protein
MSFVFLLFLVFTFLSSFSSDTSKSTSITERQKAKMAESDQNALKVHFGNDDEALQKHLNPNTNISPNPKPNLNINE